MRLASEAIGRKPMIRTFSAMAIAGLVLMAVAGTSQAAPIAPLPAGVMADHGKVMQVRWHRRCRRRSWGRWHCLRDILTRHPQFGQGQWPSTPEGGNLFLRSAAQPRRG